MLDLLKYMGEFIVYDWKKLVIFFCIYDSCFFKLNFGMRLVFIVFLRVVLMLYFVGIRFILGWKI